MDLVGLQKNSFQQEIARRKISIKFLLLNYNCSHKLKIVYYL